MLLQACLRDSDHRVLPQCTPRPIRPSAPPPPPATADDKEPSRRPGSHVQTVATSKVHFTFDLKL